MLLLLIAWRARAGDGQGIVRTGAVAIARNIAQGLDSVLPIVRHTLAGRLQNLEIGDLDLGEIEGLMVVVVVVCRRMHVVVVESLFPV